jgi:hypothetical protein
MCKVFCFLIALRGSRKFLVAVVGQAGHPTTATKEERAAGVQNDLHVALVNIEQVLFNTGLALNI